jgi:hypothetical protein
LRFSIRDAPAFVPAQALIEMPGFGVPNIPPVRWHRDCFRSASGEMTLHRALLRCTFDAVTMSSGGRRNLAFIAQCAYCRGYRGYVPSQMKRT